MSADREPTAVEVIAGALHQAHWDVRDAGEPALGSLNAGRHHAEAVVAAVRAMTPQQQAELIGGEVQGGCASATFKYYARVVGPWVQP